jgi:hypothetical protein
MKNRVMRLNFVIRQAAKKVTLTDELHIFTKFVQNPQELIQKPF